MFFIGDRFEEEEIDKKQTFYNQKARDHKGRTRFQGAFSGGFVAGYKNTCGSRDGFTPQQYSQKQTNKTVFDYMDEEDIGDQMINHNLKIRDEFIYQPDDDSIGYQILNNLCMNQVNSFDNIHQYQASKDAFVKQTIEYQSYQSNIVRSQKNSHLNGQDPNAYCFFKELYSNYYSKPIHQNNRTSSPNRIYTNSLNQNEEVEQLNKYEMYEDQVLMNDNNHNHDKLNKLSDIFSKGEVQQTRFQTEYTKQTIVPKDYDPFTYKVNKQQDDQKEQKEYQLKFQQLKKTNMINQQSNDTKQNQSENKKDDKQQEVKVGGRTQMRFYVNETSPTDNQIIKQMELIQEQSQKNRDENKIIDQYRDVLYKRVKGNSFLEGKFKKTEVQITDSQVEKVEQNKSGEDVFKSMFNE